MNIGIIGAGNMARAIVKGAAASNLLEDFQIFVSDRDEAALERFDFCFVNKLKSNAELCLTCNIIALLVKPANAKEVFGEIRGALNSDKIIVSFMAGVTLETLRAELPNVKKFVRVMPNLAAKIGMSMNAARYINLGASEKGIIENLLRGIGVTQEIEDGLFDIATAVGGSGPAYYYTFIDAIALAAEKRGMTPVQARLFSAQAALGAAAAVLEEDTEINAMRDAVCSKGGTTIEAIKVLQNVNIYDIIDKAVEAAYKRAGELSGNNLKIKPEVF